nr:hypothetical protein [Tanacetum cinerariifolium]
MRKDEIATWDGGRSTWGGRVRGLGTVLVCVSVQEMVYEGGTFWQEKQFRATVKVFTTLRVNSLSFSGRTVPLFASMLVTQDEPASLLRDDSQGEAFPTVSSLDAGQDMKNINKTSALPHESSPVVTSLDAYEGKISGLKARVKLLEEKDSRSVEPSQEDAPIKRGSMEIEEEVGVERSTELGTVSVSPVAGATTVGVPTVSGLFPTVSAIFTTASVVTPYSRRPREISAKDKGMEKVVESKVPTKRKLQEHIDAQVATEMEEEFTRYNQRSNEMIAKHLQEYEQAGADLFVGEMIELINELVKYQDHHAKILKYQAQQSKPLSKKEQRKFYMSVLRSYTGWKTRHFRGMTLEEIKEKVIPIWKQFEDFMPMSSKEEGKRIKRKGLKLDQGSAKNMKTSEDVSKEDLNGMMELVPLEEVYVKALQVKHPIIDWEIHFEGQREYWKIIRLGGHTTVYQFFMDMLKQFDRKDLHQLWILVKETLSIKQATKDKENELWVELKRLLEHDFEDQLWNHNQAFRHNPLEWKLYDTCGVHHVFTKDQEIFMLVEKDYPLRKGLATVMICNKLKWLMI